MRPVIYFITILLYLLPGWAMAQQSGIIFRNRLGDSVQLVNTAEKPPKEKKIKPLHSEWSAGLQLNTNGWGVVIDYGRYFGAAQFGNKTDQFHHVNLFQLEIGEIKHPKELRSGGSFLGITMQPQSYILGKINNFYRVKLGYGQRRMIAGKPESGTVAVHWIYAGGLALGLVKPYYLNLITTGSTRYSEDNEATFVNPGYINGAAGFSKGFNEIKTVMGIHAKSGLHFDFANRRKLVAAIELGINAEYYFKKIDQMVGQDPKSSFVNLYGVIQLGKRN